MFLFFTSNLVLAQGVSLSITDAEVGTINIETTTGSNDNGHISCCEPFVLEISVNNDNVQDENLYLAFPYFPPNEVYDLTECEVCSVEFISDNDPDCDPDNSMVVIDEIIPGGTPPQPNPYEWEIKIPFYNTNSGWLDIWYRNDQGNIVSTQIFIQSDDANCPTDVGKITDLTQTECGDEGWPSSSEICMGLKFLDDIRPQQDVIIDVDEYCFKGNSTNYVDFSFGPGKQLIVEEGNKLTLEYVHFYTCLDKMWKGIYVEKGAELIMTDCIVEDAEFGIVFEKGAILTLEDNEFTDNYVHMNGLSVRVAEDTGPDTEIKSFKRNTFTGTGSLVSKYEGQTTNPQDYPYAGILLGDGSAAWRTCGVLRFTTDIVNDINEFSNLANGIVNQRDGGHLLLKGSTFNNINSDIGTGYSSTGFGIKHESLLKSCIINGFDNWPDGYSFRNVGTALRTNLAYYVHFKKQRVDSSDRGVHSTKTLISSYINDNNIITDYDGIEVSNSYIGRNFEIIDNYVKVVTANYPEEVSAVKLSNVHSKDGIYRGQIRNNLLVVDQGHLSFGAKNTHNFDVKDNYCIGRENNVNYKGMFFHGGSNHVINCNEVVSNYTGSGSNTESRAIEIAGLSHSLLQCNYVRYTEVGIQVFGNCDSTQIRGTYLDANSYGVRYGYSAVDDADYAITGTQEYNGNKWAASYSISGQYGALHFDQRNYLESQYLVNDNPSSIYNTIDLPSDFVVEKYTDTNYECEYDSCSASLSQIAGGWTSVDSIALLDSGINHTYEYFLLLDLQLHVLNRMQQGWLSHNSNFFQLAQQKGLVDIYDAEQQLASRVRINNVPYLDGLNITESNIENLLDQQWDTVFIEATGVYDSLQNALGEWSNPVPDTGSYHALHHMAFEKQKDLWQTQKGYIQSFSIPECTLKGGDAWYVLNSLQPPSSATYQLDTSNCARAGIREYHSIDKEDEDNMLLIYPNPAENYLYVKHADGKEYKIFNSNGHLVQEGKLNDDSRILFTRAYQSGVYFMKVGTKTKRFTIIQ